jgi:hypothetical protein
MHSEGIQEAAMRLAIPSMFPRADRTHVVRDNETETWRSDYTERKAGVPQVLLVEQQIPGSKILPHFHGIDQFQVFMDGTGKLGHHAVHPISIHYTNSYTGYGPIEAGPQGLSYYVLRPSFDTLGSQYLHVPEGRANLKPGGKRFFLADDIEAESEDALRVLQTPRVKRVIGVEANDPEAGLFVDIVSLPPNAPYEMCEPATGGGQVVIVIAGGIVCNSEKLGVRSSIAVTREEEPITFAAGAAGAQLMAMQYPRRDAPWT